MECSQFRRLISREMDGAIEAAERSELDRHIGSCVGCRRFRELLLAGLAIHRSAVAVDPPGSLVPSIMTAVEARHEAGWLRGRLRFVVPAAAAAGAVLGVWIGGIIRESYVPRSAENHTDVLELKYLDEFPPGSVGDVLIASNEGGENGQR